MYKAIAILLIIVLGGYLAYHYITEEQVDPRTSIDRGIAQVKKERTLTKQEDDLLRLQLAVVTYMSSAGGKPPTSLDVLIPQYIDFIPKDPSTNEPYAYRVEGMRYYIGQEGTKTQLAAVPGAPGVITQGGAATTAQAGTFVNPNTMQQEDFIYDPTGRRDPFRPFNLARREEKEGPIPPLERYKLIQLRLTAVISDSQGKLKGNVEDEQGKGYFVESGTKIGDSNGVVIAVEKDKIKVLETTKDFAGNETQKVTEMPIQKSASDKGGSSQQRQPARKR